ncbi:MAG: DNA polymerase III subunit gamma/tau, partial [Alphaproteobacteria bacterium]|nr:DNA polymerase III subunit gamma/tau [Alphaproteobacteria bacterium]
VTAKQIREMVGLVDRTVTLDLFDYLMSGNIKEALELFSEQYVLGANPLVVVQDLMEITHWLTRMKAAPFTISDSKIAGMEKRCSEMSKKLSMAILARTWQMLLKGLREAQFAPSSLQAVEMLLIRISYVADLPTPEDTIKKIQKDAKNGNISTPVVNSIETKQEKAQETVVAKPETPQSPLKKKLPESFEEVVALFDEKKEVLIANQLKEAVHLIRFEQGMIEISLEPFADKDLALKTAKMLSEWTNIKWNIYVSSSSKGETTLKEQADSIASQKREDATENPIVKNVLETFNGSCVTDVKTLEQKTE